MTTKKTDKLFQRNQHPHKKNSDKIWCPEGEQYRYIEVCKASCKKINRCKAYADYHEPKFI